MPVASFNQPIGGWDVSSVTNMWGILYGATAFNQPIGDWDVSSVTNLYGMLNEASSFNQPIDSWDVSSATEMGYMFGNASDFNQNISSWQFNDDLSLFGFINNSGLDINNYEALLAAFSNQNLVNKVLGAQNLKYCNTAVRDDLINNKGWWGLPTPLLVSQHPII